MLASVRIPSQGYRRKFKEKRALDILLSKAKAKIRGSETAEAQRRTELKKCSSSSRWERWLRLRESWQHWESEPQE